MTRVAGLTQRECEVLGLVAAGLSNQEIEALVLSPLTAKTHVSRILAKTGARDRAQLVIHAYESGLAGRVAMPHAADPDPTPSMERQAAAAAMSPLAPTGLLHQWDGHLIGSRPWD